MIYGSTHPDPSATRTEKVTNEPAAKPSTGTLFTDETLNKNLRKKSLSGFSVEAEAHTHKHLIKSHCCPSQKFPEHNLTLVQKRPLNTTDVLMKTEPDAGFTKLHQAIRDKNWEQAQQILQLEPQSVLEKDPEENNAVHLAATCGFTKCLNRMIETPQGVKALSVKNRHGFYPLCCLLGEKASATFDTELFKIAPGSPLQAHYHELLTTLEEKHHHEAVFAKSVLEAPENIALVNVMARATSQLLLTMSDDLFDEYREDVNLDLQRRNFPVSKLVDFSSKLTLSKTLKALTEEGNNNNHIVDIMSVLWRLSIFLLENEGSLDPDRLDHIHNLLGTMGKNHVIHPEWTEEVTENNFQRFCFLPTSLLINLSINA
ncbi:hypothetical protein [Endozoicomonas atrinae]|uniref:hypothetical protein n=1 Tax=Endozoicomonas atrinae TaxID=1333660 RepID=UPI000825B0AE|nr:hypothetical protein [Endozoicomonas atrinae]